MNSAEHRTLPTGQQTRLMTSLGTRVTDRVLIVALEPDGELRILCANDAFAFSAGMASRDIIGLRTSQLVGSLFSDPTVDARMYAAAASGLPCLQQTILYDRALGAEIIVNVKAIGIPNPSDVNDQELIAIVYQDVPGTGAQSSALPRPILHDPLTDLPNRALCLNRLSHIASRMRRLTDIKAAILSVGIDRFKSVNELHGHQAGDLLLVAVARRLEKLVRPGDTLSRLQGDEFGILLDDSDEAIGEVVAHRVIDCLKEPFLIGQHEVFISASIGISVMSAEYKGANAAEDIMCDADIAMQRAKNSGKNRYAIFQNSFRTAARRRLQLQTDLRLAGERGEISVHYQPIIAVSTGRLRGFEALLRWTHPTFGSVSPGEFIPIAEDAGLIVPIGTWTLREVCRQMNEWQAVYPERDPICVSLNVSVKQIAEDNFGELVLASLREWNVDPMLLDIEITESILMSDPERATTVLQRLRSAGVEIHIDDFGTGYSSLAYLKQFTVDTLKIDKSFVSGGVDRGLANPTIVQTIIDLAKSLRLSVIAEGVETLEQALALKGMDCTNTQGHYHAAALSPDQVSSFLATDIHAKDLVC